MERRHFVFGRRIALPLSLIAILMVSGAGLVAAPAKITLSFLHKWPEEANIAYFNDLIKRFEKQHPNVTIKMEAVGDQDIKDKLRIMVGGTCPDVFFSWSGEFAKNFVRAGKALDLTPYFEKDKAWKSSFISAALSPTTFDGKLYGVPIRLDIMMGYYNKKMFDQYGLKAPKTWDEFLSACEKLKAAGKTPILFGNQQPWASAHYITALNYMIVDKSVRATDYMPSTGKFTDPGYVKALECLLSLQAKGYFNKNVNSTTFYQMREIFYTGQGGMFFDTLSDMPKYEQFMGKGEWGSFPFPVYTAGRGVVNSTPGSSDVFLVSKDCKNPDIAIEFLKFMTNAENAAKFAKDTGYPIPVKGAINAKTSMPQMVACMADLEKFGELAEWLDTALNAKIVDKYLTSLQELFNGKSPEDCMKGIRTVAAEVAETTR